MGTSNGNPGQIRLKAINVYIDIIAREEEEFLSDDVSIIIAHNKKTKEHMDIISLLSFMNINVLPFADEIPVEVMKCSVRWKTGS